ncbi:tyrosine-type recombinase/integrase [Limnochorda pilosa]|uniref:Tyrosine recombinase XerD n=1 Tax=Limnochorda pilosa TaxID=1555112 RepID=A0A0K2SM95_LIMPI|nr:tyrosine-type recombinase/integrase [Limnochorda pilosa]BAS28225.1 tyrosine recombinase XerD [Limnochorda pilosa]
MRRTLGRAIADFLVHIRMERSFSRNTATAYRRDLRSFTRFLALQGADPELLDPEDIGRPDVRAYLVHLAAERGLKSSSASRHLACLRSFFRFLAEDERWQISHDPTLGVRHPKTARRVPSVLSVAEVERLLAASEKVSPYPQRDRALIQLLVQTGCRVGEVARLRLEHLDLDRNTATFLGKGEKDRVVPVTPTTVAQLRRYLEEERPRLARNASEASTGPGAAVFLNTRGRPLSAGGVRRLFREIRKHAGIGKRVTVHTLRYTCLTFLMEAGVDLRMLQELAGHASLHTTQLYTHLAQWRKTDAVMKHPFA